MEYMVTAIRRDGADLDRRIDWLEGPSFSASIDTVINRILVHRDAFFVPLGPALSDPVAYLDVKAHWQSGRLFLQTIPDGLHDNNLYSLPEIEVRRLGATLLRQNSWPT